MPESGCLRAVRLLMAWDAQYLGTPIVRAICFDFIYVYSFSKEIYEPRTITMCKPRSETTYTKHLLKHVCQSDEPRKKNNRQVMESKDYKHTQ